MYKKCNIRSARKSVIPMPEADQFECDHYYKSFSYYVRGGNDPTGEHLSLDGHPSFDTTEDIEAGCSVDAFADPKTSFFDIVEQIGFEKANQTAKKTE